MKIFLVEQGADTTIVNSGSLIRPYCSLGLDKFVN